MSDSVTIEIAGTPIGKGRGRAAVVNGRAMVFTPGKTRQWEAWARVASQEAMHGAPPIEGPVNAVITAYMPVAASWPAWKQQAALNGLILPTSKPDSDNIKKACLDALNSVVFRDDSQVVQSFIGKWFSDRPRVVIEITPLSEAPQQITRQADLNTQPLLKGAVG